MNTQRPGASGGWTGFANFAGTGWDPTVGVGRNADGRMEVFQFLSGQPYHAWQLTANGAWSGWATLEDG